MDDAIAKSWPLLLVLESKCCRTSTTGILLSSNNRFVCSIEIAVPSAPIVIGVFSSFNVTRFQLRLSLLSTAPLITISINFRSCKE